MTTTAQPWLRAELIAGPETTPGAQLMIPADGVEFHDDHLVFHHQGEVVYVADQGQLRSITWFAKQPNPETARRKALWPNHGTRWTDDQRADLLRRLRLGQSWAAISTAAGRSRTGCQQEAVKQGWLDPDTLRPLPGLLVGQPASPSDAAATQPSATPDPDAGDADPPPTANATDHGNASCEPIASAHQTSTPQISADQISADQTSAPQISADQISADQISADQISAHQAFVPAEDPATAPAPSMPAEPTGSPSAAPAAPDIRAGSGTEADAPPTPSPSPSPSPADPTPAEALAALLQGTDTGSDTGSSLYFGPMPSAVPMARRNSDDAAPPQPETPPPHPDGPRPRIPRQRTGSDAAPESGADPGPGNRFMNRAQSSLSRAALRSSMNPSRGQPTGTT